MTAELLSRRAAVLAVRRALCGPRPPTDEVAIVEGDEMFIAIYGLPLPVVTELCMNTLARYIEAFRMWYPISAFERTPGDLINWFATEEGQRDRRDPIVTQIDPKECRADSEFLNAVSLPMYMVRTPPGDPSELVNAAVSLLFSYVRQRKENVWAADDPVAYSVEEQITDQLQASHFPAGKAEARKITADVLALADYMGSRAKSDNTALQAVARREWRLILNDLLRISR